MRSLDEVDKLLYGLNIDPADQLESQDLDFKEWNTKSTDDAVALVVEMAVCMANGGGGTVVCGVNDKAIGRDKAVLGVPHEINVNRLKKSVYDRTDPKLMPVFEELYTPEGTGRLLVMQVHSGLPPHTDTAGQGKIRIGTDCQPLTGTLRRRIMVETGETDFTAAEIPSDPEMHVSATAMEQPREAARQERVPGELLDLNDLDLLHTLGLRRVDNSHLTRAGVLLAGKEASIREHLPGYASTHLRMRGDTQYTDRADGVEALPVALARLTDRIMADNPITTVEQGMFHFEYRTYSEIALREALMNAFCHSDLRIPGPILSKQFHDKITIGNFGGFIGGYFARQHLAPCAGGSKPTSSRGAHPAAACEPEQSGDRTHVFGSADRRERAATYRGTGRGGEADVFGGGTLHAFPRFCGGGESAQSSIFRGSSADPSALAETRGDRHRNCSPYLPAPGG